MAAAFTLTDVSLHYSEKQLLSHISITISEGDKIGVVGRNGAGKSTLLRLLAGTEEPDAGDIARKRGLTLAYLPQTPHLRPEDSITQAALSFLPTANEAERESAAYEAQTILSRLGFTDFDQRVGTLSGGQQMRVALAGALCRKADVLLLDEPTNHIDLDMAAWLEDYLAAYRGTLICVTHDRYLLERVFNRIFQVGGGQVQTYQTDYAGYLEERAQREEMAAATLRKQKSLYRTELAWIQRGARARSTKAKGRIDRFETLKENVREAPPEAQLQMKSVASRLGKKILSCEHLHCELGGRTLVRDFSYTLLRDDRVGIVGGNGAGKTTLMQVLAGFRKPYRGKVRLAKGQRLCMLPQNARSLFVADTVEKELLDSAEQDKAKAVQMAERLELTPLLARHPYDLSGGEIQRLAVGKLLLREATVLLLDEPTKGLDAYAKAELAQLLLVLCREGASILVVTHDVEFAARYATGCALMFDGLLLSEGEPHDFFAGNRFYTTDANRIAAEHFPMDITCEEVIASCRSSLSAAAPELPRG